MLTPEYENSMDDAPIRDGNTASSAAEAQRIKDSAAEMERRRIDLIERLRSEIEDRKQALRALGALRVRKPSKRGPGRPKGSKNRVPEVQA